jgi:hypothetical protein
MISDERPCAVFDTMLFLQATGSGRGPAFAALQRFEAGDFQLCVSQALLDEVRDVLSRPEIRRKMPLLTEERVHALIERLARTARLVTEVRRWVDQGRGTPRLIACFPQEFECAIGARRNRGITPFDRRRSGVQSDSRQTWVSSSTVDWMSK